MTRLSEIYKKNGNQIKKLRSNYSVKKNYNKKPTFSDMQHEENEFLSHTSHSGKEIAKWNIDGLVEYQIYNKLHEKIMAMTTYKIGRMSNKPAMFMIISGFTGTIKYWWDNYLTYNNSQRILNATTITQTIKTESTGRTIENQVSEDATATLIYSIAKHFIGEPQLFQDRNLEILSNLSCPKLDTFRWYKDVFLNKVKIREDCNHDYWKEKFISGLPTLFAEKVRTKLKDRFEGKIPWSNLTYGDIISFINVTKLELCTDIKLKN